MLESPFKWCKNNVDSGIERWCYVSANYDGFLATTIWRMIRKESIFMWWQMDNSQLQETSQLGHMLLMYALEVSVTIPLTAEVSAGTTSSIVKVLPVKMVDMTTSKVVTIRLVEPDPQDPLLPLIQDQEDCPHPSLGFIRDICHQVLILWPTSSNSSSGLDLENK